MKKINFNEVIKEIIILTAAVAIIAAAVYFFLVPSHTSVSSISGLGIAFCCAVFSVHSHLQILLRAVCDNFTEKFCKLRCMFRGRYVSGNGACGAQRRLS